MSSESWPPQLKEWVAHCLGQMTDSNRTEAQSELKKVISDAYSSKTLWTTDWNGVQLQSLLPKAPPTLISAKNLKRKPLDAHVTGNKKTKKTKSSSSSPFLSTAASSSTPLDFNDTHALNKRALRFQREHEIEQQKNGISSFKANHNQPYLFNDSRCPSPYVDEAAADPNVMDWDKHTIVGTSKEMFKDYLRLTTEPKPETIRPLHILQLTVPELKKRWKEKGRELYPWVCNQFKSVRQDLTVQRITNEFTVNVYETHARIALEMADMVEYNACAATLRTLYSRGIPGKEEEFLAYRILDFLHGRNHRELNTLVGRLTPQQKLHTAISHALKVQQALSMANYHALFVLYEDAPWMSGYIMDHFVKRERARALVTMSKAYRTLPLKFITKELAFESDQQTSDFLDAHDASPFITNPNAQLWNRTLDCKVAQAALANAYEEKYRKIQIHGAV